MKEAEDFTVGDSVQHNGETREILGLRFWNDTMTLGPRASPEIVDIEEVN
jgi:hypothetical protein